MNTESTYNTRDALAAAPAGASAAKRLALRLARPWRRVLQSMRRSHWERETVRELSSLPSYMLRDIGLQEDDIEKVARDLARERADAWARRAQASNGFGG